jgi:predicted branched-subunit amino acid permease
LSFGAISVASGLDVWQTQALSLGMFTGASQFALVGVLGAGGGALAAVVTALLLGARNSLYALSLRPYLDTARTSWWRVLGRAQITIDESTAMAIRYPAGSRQARHAFLTTGLAIFVLWNLGTLIGALGAAALDDPRVLGLDAAVPAGFIALLWPRLRDRSAIALALASAAVAIALVPILQPGLPVLSAALVAVIAERLMARTERTS